MLNQLNNMVNEVMKHILRLDLGSHVDLNLPCPQPFIGDSRIKLVVLGQDPTVKNRKSRKTITTVLNLVVNGALKNYISDICGQLGIGLENVYATNLIKNFFHKPPAEDISLINEFARLWMGVLNWELEQFPGIPVLTLGEPVLQPIVTIGSTKVRDYWGYNSVMQKQTAKNYQYIRPWCNILGRPIFPFPHQPSISKTFYHDNMAHYIAYMKTKISGIPDIIHC